MGKCENPQHTKTVHGYCYSCEERGRNIEASRQRVRGYVLAKYQLSLGGDNFRFVSFGALEDLKLWPRAAEGVGDGRS